MTAGVIVAAMGVFVALFGASVRGTGTPSVVTGSVLILLGAVFGVQALRPGILTVDDDGLHRRALLGTRVIPWSLVRSFRARLGGRGHWWFVWVELSTGEKVILPGPQGTRERAERIAAELSEAHREYLSARNQPDRDAAGVTEMLKRRITDVTEAGRSPVDWSFRTDPRGTGRSAPGTE